jgi:hypothetical protein
MPFDPRNAPPRHEMGSSLDSAEARREPSDLQHVLAANAANAEAFAEIPAPGAKALTLGFLAAAVVALLGGLLWAGVVIVSHYDIGFLAVLVGIAVGFAVHRVAHGPVGVFERLLAGVFAAGGIFIGRYVIFIHGLNDALHHDPRTAGDSAGYFDTQWMSFFVNHFGTVLRENLYWLWFLLAAGAAFRTAGGNAPIGGGRRRL